MTKRVSKIILLILSVIVILMPNALAYEDDIFKFDIPDSYVKIENNRFYIFKDSNSERGIIIYTLEDHDMKKSVWDIKDSDFDRLVSYLSLGGTTLSKNKKAKLGKEKAAEAIIASDGTYVDIYLMASNKYIYMVCFVGESQNELNHQDYQMVKKSFKLKDHTTNPTVIYILIIGIIAAIVIFTKYRKQQKTGNFVNYNNNNNNIDYKNMTEDDFKNM